MVPASTSRPSFVLVRDLTVAVVVESALVELTTAMKDPDVSASRLALEVVDISATTWEGVVVVRSSTLDETTIRDRMLRSVLGCLGSRAIPA